MAGVDVDHAAVAHDRDALAGMGGHDALDRLDDHGAEVLRLLGHLVPAWIVGGLELLDGDVAGDVAVVLGDPVVDA